MSDKIKADVATWSDETIKETATNHADSLRRINHIANACLIDELVTRFQRQQAEIEWMKRKSVENFALRDDCIRDKTKLIHERQAEIERLRGLVREARSYINALQNYDVVVGSEYRQMLKWLSAAGEVGE